MNYLAVAVAVIVVFVISSAWYVAWGSLYRTLSPAAAATDKAPTWKYALEIVRSLVLATVIAGLSARLDLESLAGAALLGLTLWVGFPVILLTGSVEWENVPWKLAALHAGDWLLKLLAIAVIVTLWR
jgi:hypothetical protein